MDIRNRVAFTGHRTYNNQSNNELHYVIQKLYKRGFRVFMSGMAAGFDLAAAEVVMELKTIYIDIKLSCIVPFKGQNNKFSNTDNERYNNIISKADEVVVLSESYYKGCYLHRNDHLIANSSLIVTYYDGSKGGTDYTVRKARREKYEILNIYKSPQQTLF